MATDIELKNMVEIYNRNERIQQDYLEEIFEAIDSRKGFREVTFGDGVNDGVAKWSNAWGRRRDLWEKQFIQPMTRIITSYDAGETD
jgi:hypothetical protein